MAGTDRTPGWYADPTRRFERRYFDGRRWTRRVRVGTAEAVDTLSVARELQPDVAAARDAPGWRTDPDDRDKERFWDGHDWTAASRPARPRRAHGRPRWPWHPLLVQAVVFALLLLALAAVLVWALFD